MIRNSSTESTDRADIITQSLCHIEGNFGEFGKDHKFATKLHRPKFVEFEVHS